MAVYIRLFVLLCVGLLPVWLLLRRPWRRTSPCREAVLAAFAVYVGALLCLVLRGTWGSPAAMLQSARARLISGENINLRPFGVMGQFRRFDEAFWVYVVGNVVMFVPWGLCLPLLWRPFRRPAVGLLACLALTVSIETAQLFIGRVVDVDDVLLNFLGGMAGYVLACAMLGREASQTRRAR